MSEDFFKNPILNSPYEYPGRHWELDDDGQPTGDVMDYRRSAKFVTPVPKPRKRKDKKPVAYTQAALAIGAEGVTTAERQYDTTSMVNSIRAEVDQWRLIPEPARWRVTPETARLLQHWRSHPFQGIRPFFCQIEAVETIIWLTEVAPSMGKAQQALLDNIADANAEANPELNRIALKLATGAGKTMVMAMIIAWQTINAVRHPQSERFTRGFLVATPGITIRDRLRVLFPNDPDSYYTSRELVPPDLQPELGKAKIVVTNYHAFKRRETLKLAAGTRDLLQGRGPALETVESEGQMLQRVMPELLTMKRILIINDEAHHCYREKVHEDEEKLDSDEREEALRNNEAARLWINGLEAVKRKVGVGTVLDLSATPFFLRGSGYAEGTLFHWTVSDFSLMDAIECGIVKLPRVPVADNVPGGDMPKLRNLWEHIRTRMPKKGRTKAGALDPLLLPAELQTALDALYGHYARTYDLWQEAGIVTPPVFIVVCNNTSTSKLVYDYIGGFVRGDSAADGGQTFYHEGRLPLFRNYDANGNRLARPMTLLIDSEQLESGDALDANFRDMAADEIERFRRELRERGDPATANNVTDQDLLREVMNTVGKENRLGESVRCVVSVGMLTEGWDCNTVTHILGVRAFGTQLLCEQVVGRALRRQSYDLNEENKFNVEYADILGIPFDFTAQPVVATPKKPNRTIHVEAVRPHRDHLEITFPRVTGYRVELPQTRLGARFNADSVLELNPNLVGATITENSGIIGESVDLTVQHLRDVREATIAYKLAGYLLYTKYRDPGEEPKLHLFGQLKAVTREWLEGGYLRCSGGAYPAQVLYYEIAEMACERIKAAITEAIEGDKPVLAILDAYNPTGSSRFVNFFSGKSTRWRTDPNKCPVNWIICDGDWEAEFCRVVERHPRVLAYVANQGMGFEVPYLFKGVKRTYIPDFIVRIDDGRSDPLHLVVEIKGYRKEDAKEKANTMRTQWVPGVNNLKSYGRWAHAEFTAVYEMEEEFDKLIASLIS
jgi:type III restriction enzyme